MTRSFKRSFSLFTVLAMVLTLFSGIAMAEEHEYPTVEELDALSVAGVVGTYNISAELEDLEDHLDGVDENSDLVIQVQGDELEMEFEEDPDRFRKTNIQEYTEEELEAAHITFADVDLDPVEEYVLTVNVEGEGYVDVDPDQDQYEEGTEVELEAVADEGNEFVEWTGDYENGDAEITLTMDEDKEVTANFEELAVEKIYPDENYSWSASEIYDFDGEIEQDEYREGAEVELYFVNEDRRSVSGETIHFLVETNRGTEDLYLYNDGQEIDLDDEESLSDYTDVEENIGSEGIKKLGIDPSGLRTEDPDNVWLVEATTGNDGEVYFYIDSEMPGDVDVHVGADLRVDAQDYVYVTRGLNKSPIEIEVEGHEANYFEMDANKDIDESYGDPDDGYSKDDARSFFNSAIKAGDYYDIGATVYEYEGGPKVRDKEVTFYAREDADDNWSEVGTAETDRRGKADLEDLRSYDAESFEYTVEVGDIDGRDEIEDLEDEDYSIPNYLKQEVVVIANEPYEIFEVDEEMNIEEDEEKVYFEMEDRYGNANEGWIYRDRIVDGDITDPDGDDTIDSEAKDWCADEDAYYLEVDFEELGQWTVEGRITGTTRTAETVVNVGEFGNVADLDIEFTEDEVMRRLWDEHEEDYYFAIDNEVDITLIDENGIEKDYDTSDEDILFTSSNGRAAAVDSRNGNIDGRRTGETEITALHQDADIEVSKDLYLAKSPSGIVAEADIDEDSLTGEVTLTMLDDDGVKSQPGEWVAGDTNDREFDTGYYEFVDEDEYDVVLPAGLSLVEDSKEDFEDGVATFEVEADYEDEYEARVVSDEGLTTRINLDFVQEPDVPERTIVEMAIGSMNYTIDDDEFTMDVAPEIRDGRTLVPYRAIGEALGAQVDWDSADDSITVSLDDRDAVMYLDDNTMTVNGDEIEMDIAPVLENGRTMVPLRAVSEAFDAYVDWDNVTETIMIEYLVN